MLTSCSAGSSWPLVSRTTGNLAALCDLMSSRSSREPSSG